MSSPRPTVKHLLLLENDGLSTLVTPLLEERGWTVRACTSVREALVVAKQARIDGLMVTLHLPDERGDVAYYRIAAEHPHLRTCTVFLIHTPADRDSVSPIGRPIIMLPAEPTMIVQTLDDVCRSKGLLDSCNE